MSVIPLDMMGNYYRCIMMILKMVAMTNTDEYDLNTGIYRGLIFFNYFLDHQNAVVYMMLMMTLMTMMVTSNMMLARS